MSERTICPVCQNKKGFACGKCIECGFNYLKDDFDEIKVDVKTLRTFMTESIVDILIQKHYNKKGENQNADLCILFIGENNICKKS